MDSDLNEQKRRGRPKLPEPERTERAEAFRIRRNEYRRKKAAEKGLKRGRPRLPDEIREIRKEEQKLRNRERRRELRNQNEPKKRGRPPLNMSDEEREEHFRMMRKIWREENIERIKVYSEKRKEIRAIKE